MYTENTEKVYAHGEMVDLIRIDEIQFINRDTIRNCYYDPYSAIIPGFLAIRANKSTGLTTYVSIAQIALIRINDTYGEYIGSNFIPPTEYRERD